MARILIHLEPGYIPHFNKEKLHATMKAIDERLGQAGKGLTCNELVEEMIKEKSGQADPGKQSTMLLAAFVAGMQENGHTIYMVSGRNEPLREEDLRGVDIIMVLQNQTMLASGYKDKLHSDFGGSISLPEVMLVVIKETGQEQSNTQGLSTDDDFATIRLFHDRIPTKIVDMVIPANPIDRSKYSMSEGFERECNVPKLVHAGFKVSTQVPGASNAPPANRYAYQPFTMIELQLKAAKENVKGYFLKKKYSDKDSKPATGKAMPDSGKSHGLTREEQEKMSHASVSPLNPAKENVKDFFLKKKYSDKNSKPATGKTMPDTQGHGLNRKSR